MKNDKSNIELIAVDHLKDYLGITREDANDLIADIIESDSGKVIQRPSPNADELLSKSSKKPAPKKRNYLN